MHIIHIASELTPIAKVGGLGDVVHGLCKELAKDGHKVEIIIPKYDCIDSRELKKLSIEERDIVTKEGGYRYHNTIWSAMVDGLKVYLVEPHHPSFYFSRGSIYGQPDDIDRFVYFCRAAMDFLHTTKQKPDAIHLHDWPTALCAPLYKEIFLDSGFKADGIVLTIHNIEHQGKCPPQHLMRVGLKEKEILKEDKMQDPHFRTLANLLKGGITYADALTTVSPTYEKQIKTPAGGSGLDTVLVKHQKKLKGILNGIDEQYWNPEIDPYLIKHYPAHHINSNEKIEEVLEGKAKNRRKVREILGLKDNLAPLCVSVTRLVPQKGPKLIKQAIIDTLEKGGQFILLGSCSSPEIQKEFLDLHKHFSKTQHFGLFLDRDEALAHLVFAGADMTIIPSIFEPCGLTQLIALRYGTVPIVRATGGLADTVFDIDSSNKPEDLRNGYCFSIPNTKEVDWVMGRAFECWKRDPEKWRRIMSQGMNEDFSWRSSAREYIKIYSHLNEKKSTQFESALLLKNSS